MARFYFFCLAFDQILKENLLGDVAELGVYQGHTASILAEFTKRTARELYLLDTFSGFSAVDLSGVDANKKGNFAETSLGAVEQFIGERGVNYVQGRFPETAARLPQNGHYCLVHIDCDLYAPIMSGLEYFYPRMTPGGFIVVHDYSSLHWDGAEKAVDEFFRDRPEYVIPLPDSAGSVVIRKVGEDRKP
jgi:hypothetical protein